MNFLRIIFSKKAERQNGFTTPPQMVLASVAQSAAKDSLLETIRATLDAQENRKIKRARHEE